jgi:succinyl-CoA synthetase beta subunit
LINIFGGIVRCDRVAQGVVEAAGNVDLKVPVVVRLEGTNAEEARAILEASTIEFVVAHSLREAAEKVVSVI